MLSNALKLMDGKYGGAFYVRYICDTGRGCGWLQLVIEYPTGMVQTQLLCKNVCKISTYEEDGLPKITPHICRHTYCTNMAKLGIAVKTLQYLMGHADVATTLNVYTHLKLEDAKDELEQLKARDQLKKEMALVDMENAKRELKRVSAV